MNNQEIAAAIDKINSNRLAEDSEAELLTWSRIALAEPTVVALMTRCSTYEARLFQGDLRRAIRTPGFSRESTNFAAAMILANA